MKAWKSAAVKGSLLLVVACGGRAGTREQPVATGAVGGSPLEGEGPGVGGSDAAPGEGGGDVAPPLPVPTADCSDGVHNGEELGIDCGGLCSPSCPIVYEPCDCASSDALLAIACGGIDLWGAFLSFDGASLVYHQQNETYRWTRGAGREQLFPAAEVRGLSADASTLLMQPLSSPAFLWSMGQPNVELPHASPRASSADGRVVLFFVESTRTPEIWREGSSIAVGESPMTSFNFARALSGDGAVVVGARYEADDAGGHQLPFRWTEAVGLELLGPLPMGTIQGTAVVTSRDGSVAAGWIYGAADESPSFFRWTRDGGLAPIAPTFVAHGAFIEPLLSDDGSVLVGTLPFGSGELGRAFRWTEATGTVVLDGASGAPSTAQLASADGRIILGIQGSDEQRPFIWSSAKGLRDLSSAVADAGTDLEGWVLGSPRALSKDGHVIVGMGTCGGIQAAYRVVLPD